MKILSAIIFYTIGYLVGQADINWARFSPFKKSKGNHRHKWIICYDDTSNFNFNVGMQIFSCNCGSKKYIKMAKGKKSFIEILEKI